MNIDKDNRKPSWVTSRSKKIPRNTLENTFPVGSIHEGTVIRKDDKGAIVQLPYGLEGIRSCPSPDEGGWQGVVAEEVNKFMVIEFDRNDKRIVLSHTRLWEQAVEEEKQAVMKERKAEAEITKGREESAEQSRENLPWATWVFWLI